MSNTSWISVSAANGQTFDAYLSLPPTGRGPGLLLIQEIFGVNELIRAVADQFAADGYVVLAPDIFWRSEKKLQLQYDQAGFDKGLALLGSLDIDATASDLKAAVATLRRHTACSGKVGSIGYCMGGLLSFVAAAEAGVDTAVCYYGGGIPNQLAAAARIRVPVLFHFAGNDKHIPLEGVEKVKAEFASHAGSAVHVYAGVDPSEVMNLRG